MFCILEHPSSAHPGTIDSPGSLLQGQERCSWTERGQGEAQDTSPRDGTLSHITQHDPLATVYSHHGKPDPHPSLWHWKAPKSLFLIQGHAWASVVCNCVMLDNWATSVFTWVQLWVLGKHSKHCPGLSIEDICHHKIPKGRERLFHMCTHKSKWPFLFQHRFSHNLRYLGQRKWS